MRFIRRILVAIKSPEQSSGALTTKVASLASAFGAEVELFHATTAPAHAAIIHRASQIQALDCDALILKPPHFQSEVARSAGSNADPAAA